MESLHEEAVPHEFEEHFKYRNYMRDVVLGANDGLVSVFALVIGVAAGGLGPKQVLLTGIAGLVAGAISMAIGEYISTKSQEEVYDSEKRLEQEHIKHHLDHEKEELYEFYSAKGFKGDILDTIVETIASDEKVLLREMMMAEFGVLEEERRSPFTATAIIGVAFALGSLPPVIPFLFANSTTSGMIMAFFLSVIGLFGIGGLKAKVTSMDIRKAGLENLVLGVLGAGVTYIIGLLIGQAI